MLITIRRAKIKLLAKKSIETGEDCDAIPQSYRDYLAQQAMESGKPLTRNLLNQPMSFGNGGMLIGENPNPSKVGKLNEKLLYLVCKILMHLTVIHHFTCRSLSIGSWRRVGQNAMDLVIFYSLGEKPCLTYYINNESAGYKIEFPFSSIKNITLNAQADESLPRPPGLSVELNRPPNFYMDSSGSGGFYQCGDFTENQQASQVLLHYLGGDPRVLSGQLAKLTVLEPFRNRHMPLMDTSAIAMSAPVSPAIPRPASQPNAMPPPPINNVFHDNSFGLGLQPGPRGHKRTRSRSVPALTDFSFLNHPMPSFHVHHPSTTITDPSIFAPVPQHVNNLSPANTLRIDTAHAFNPMDYRQYPMSAATTNSPSDYASPGFFGNGSMDQVQSAGFAPSYSMPYLSPMQEQAHPQPSGSPLSAISQHDPIIADHSPPLSNIHRSASADFLSGLSLQDDHPQNFDDDSVMLSEMYSKQMNLPIRSPISMHEAQMHTPPKMEDPHHDEFNQNVFGFGTVDPSAISHGM